MDQRKYNNNLPWDDRIYGTGRTQPRKNHGGLIAFLLILVILLSGIVGILGTMNIKLFAQLKAQKLEDNAMTFSVRARPLPTFWTLLKARIPLKLMRPIPPASIFSRHRKVRKITPRKMPFPGRRFMTGILFPWFPSFATIAPEPVLF